MTLHDSTGADLRDSKKAGLEFPYRSEEGLLRGASFFNDDFRSDLEEFCRRIRSYVEGALPISQAMNLAMDELTLKPSIGALRDFRRLLDFADDIPDLPVVTCRLRCQYYLACAGDAEAAHVISGEAAMLAMRDIHRGEYTQLASVALSWGVTAHFISSLSKIVDLQATVSSVDHFRRNALRTFDRVLVRRIRAV